MVVLYPIQTPPPIQTPQSAGRAPDPTQLRAKAEEIEVAFLSEMLRHAGLGAEGGSFSGGIGEEQFASFLREEQARAIVAAGGLGLTETVFQSLMAKTGA